MKLRKILKVKALPDFTLSVLFEEGVEKTVDFKPYFKFPVFEVLKTVHAFSSVRNSGYFIEWPGYEIDLSADTLWNDGKALKPKPTETACPELSGAKAKSRISLR